MQNVIVSGSFDDLRSRHIRFLEEAGRLGPVHVLLWSDDAVLRETGQRPKFPQAERAYLLQAIRFVAHHCVTDNPYDADCLPAYVRQGTCIWVGQENGSNGTAASLCETRGFHHEVIPESRLTRFPQPSFETFPSLRKRVIVTGCFDWLHSGHVRFFEEVAALGDLHVVVGSDANVRLLKGAPHPMFSQQERRYVAGAIRYVKQALISTGQGWLDAEPEIQRLKPHIYAVNEDGDKPQKRQYCEQNGIDYVVLKRVPKDGLPARQSTVFRGF
jgi:cytidyltransferase-like protein